MSDFKVEVRRVAEVATHSNAERLEVAKLEGLLYPFVIAKGSFRPGDLCVYFPLDALIPAPLASLIGLPVKGDQPFRVKSIRLRGVWSEGVLAPMSIIGLDEKIGGLGTDLTAVLGVKKYEPPPDKEFSIFKGARPDHLQALPTTVRRYDIENLQRYPEVYKALVGQRVVITEKLEGTHFWARIDKDGETFHVGQRNYEIKRGEETDTLHPFWEAFYKENIDTFLHWLSSYFRGYDVTVRGELIGDGVQGNYYGLPKGVREIHLFEIELNGEPVDAEVFIGLTDNYNMNHLRLDSNGKMVGGIRRVPLLWYYNTISEVAPSVEEMVARAHGVSVLSVDGKPLLREGIVIKPARETYAPEIGRLFIKVRDAEYLAQ